MLFVDPLHKSFKTTYGGMYYGARVATKDFLTKPPHQSPLGAKSNSNEMIVTPREGTIGMIST